MVALGLASGFMEPLESTSIYLIQSGISKLLNLFPRQGISEVLVDRYNAQLAFEFDRIRDFLVLHYHATERDDTRSGGSAATCRSRPELQATIDLFRDSGRFFRNADEMFAEISWVQVMLGQGIMPKRLPPAGRPGGGRRHVPLHRRRRPDHRSLRGRDARRTRRSSTGSARPRRCRA